MVRNKKLDKLNDSASEKNRLESVKEGLTEIYQDDSGEIIDVKQLKIKSKRGLVFWLLSALGYLAALALIIMGVIYYLNRGTDSTAVDFTIDGPEQVIAGQEFFYELDYQNLDNVSLKNITIRLEYPENFVFLEASPKPTKDNNVWHQDELASHRGDIIKIKGILVNQVDKGNFILAEMSYQPDNFTSEFKKNASIETKVSDTGIEIIPVFPASILAGEANKLIIKYRAKDLGFIDNFQLKVEPTNPSNVEFIDKETNKPGVRQVKPWVWQVNEITKEEAEIPIHFRLLDKLDPEQQFILTFAYSAAPALSELTDDSATAASTISMVDTAELASTTSTPDLKIAEPKLLTFHEEIINLEIVKNNLNLILVLNGSTDDQGVNFGQELNYSIEYANKGDTPMNDVVISATIEGDLVDWDSLTGDGIRQGNSIVWTGDELPELASIERNSKGQIDFSLKVKDLAELKYEQELSFLNYAQFAVVPLADEDAILADLADAEAAALDEETSDKTSENEEPDQNLLEDKSNVIEVKLNSDLELDEKLRYFDENNIPVGSGTLPFESGQTTGLRSYWNITNTLHDLKNVQVSLDLPDYVTWDNKALTETGQLTYDEANNRIIWEIPSLSASFESVRAEFNIAVTPTDDQRGQFIIIMPPTKIVALDTETDKEIVRQTKAKTSKLEDDDIIPTVELDLKDGLVQ